MAILLLRSYGYNFPDHVLEVVKEEMQMRKWSLKWHSKRTGMEGVTRWLGDSADEAKLSYEERHKWREVKVVTEVIDGFEEGLDG